MNEDARDGFTKLLTAIQSHKGDVNTSILQEWQELFDKFWTGTSEQWSSLVDLLPMRNKYSPDLSNIGSNLISEPSDDIRPIIAFLGTTGFRHLGARCWAEQLSQEAIMFVVGCLNLLRQAEHPQLGILVSGELRPSILRVMAHYPGTLASMRGYGCPVQTGKEGFIVAGETIRYDEAVWPEEQQIASNVAKDNATDGFLKACAIESTVVSEAFFRRFNQNQTQANQNEFLLWSGYLVPSHAFDFCWRFLTATRKSHYGNDKLVFGETVDERIAQLQQTLLDGVPSRGGMSNCGQTSSPTWRETFVTLFRPIASLLELQSYRWDSRRHEEAWSRQTEIFAHISQHAKLVVPTVRGILDYGQAHWDLLDPVVLGLSQTEVTDALVEYLNENHPHHSHYHARILLAHVKGEQIGFGHLGGASGSGILGAVENLITVSRTRLPHERSQIWLGDVAIESLWSGAIQAANKDFTEQFDSQFGQDEHEHVAVLADALARHLKATNTTTKVWLDRQRSVPAFLDISVRRFPKTAKQPLPQEGGHKGLQADLAFLMSCEIPGLAIASRVTLLQAKKVERTRDGRAWSDTVKLDQTQLSGLITVSSDAHYLFMLHSELGNSPLIFPARTVKDIAKAQTTPSIPLSMILRAAKNLPEFLLHDVIGLWTGDTSSELVKTVTLGASNGQGPRTLIEITLRPTSEQ